MDKSLIKVLKNGEKRVIGKYKQIVTAVMICIAKIENRDYIIFEKRSLNIRQGGEISLPGGKYEARDNNTKNTAIRETVEELGVAPEKIQLLGKFGTLVNPSGIILDTYISKLDIAHYDELKYNKDEVEKVIFVPFDFFLKASPKIEKIGLENIPLFSAKEFNMPKKYQKPWPGQAREVYIYNFKGEIIWGMTAEIIYEFIKVFKKS